jgi:hypothetical protein
MVDQSSAEARERRSLRDTVREVSLPVKSPFCARSARSLKKRAPAIENTEPYESPNRVFYEETKAQRNFPIC